MNIKTQNKHVVYITPKVSYPYHGPRSVGEQLDMIGGQPVIIVTEEQGEAFNRVVEHQGKENLLDVSLGGFCGDYFLALTFKHITIGIEPDGYSHS